jgi:two-component system KDP operon response regulator KdpE
VAVGELRVAVDDPEAWVGTRPVALTPSEHRLLLHLASNPGRLVPHDVLIARVWGDRDAASANTLKALVSRLRLKLQPTAGSVDWLESERGLGYRLVRPPTAGHVTDRVPALSA